MLSLSTGKKLIGLARKELEFSFRGQEVSKWEVPSELKEKRGLFVTLYSYPDRKLRGCIGFPRCVLPLYSAVKEAVKSSAFEDPRFTPLIEEELKDITIEISVLTKPILIKKQGDDLKKEIEIGKDGLIMEYSGYSGLLLPQVPVENKWNLDKFLDQLCLKTGVSPKTWRKSSCKIFKFQAQIFSEISPNGDVKEISLKC